MTIEVTKAFKLRRAVSRTLLFTGLVLAVVAASAMPATAVETKSCTNSTAVSARPNLRQGDQGSCVVVAQKLLESEGAFKAGYYSTNFGPLTDAAVRQVQRQAGITVDGIIGPVTWGVLTDGKAGGTAPAPAAPTPGTASSNLPAKCQTNSKTICIVKGAGSRATLYAVQNKAVVKSFPARTGDARGEQFVTTEGTFQVFWKNKDHVSSIYDVAMPYSMFFNGGQAIHYSANFAAHDYRGSSHGCVNLKSMNDAEWLYNWSTEATTSRAGTRVVVTR